MSPLPTDVDVWWKLHGRAESARLFPHGQGAAELKAMAAKKASTLDPNIADRLQEFGRQLQIFRSTPGFPKGLGGLADELLREIEEVVSAATEDDESEPEGISASARTIRVGRKGAVTRVKGAQGKPAFLRLEEAVLQEKIRQARRTQEAVSAAVKKPTPGQVAFMEAAAEAARRGRGKVIP